MTNEKTQAEMLATLSEQLWLSIKEASSLYGVPISTFWTWIYHEKLNPSNGLHHLGRSVRINRIEFETKFFDSKQSPYPPANGRAATAHARRTRHV